MLITKQLQVFFSSENHYCNNSILLKRTKYAHETKLRNLERKGQEKGNEKEERRTKQEGIRKRTGMEWRKNEK